MSNRFSKPTEEELKARGLGPDGKPLPKPKAKPASKKKDAE